MEIIHTNEYERISDFALITVISMYLPIEALERDPKYAPKVFFIFKRSEELDHLIEAYWKGDLRVEPQAFFTQQKNIKSRIYGDH